MKKSSLGQKCVKAGGGVNDREVVRHSCSKAGIRGWCIMQMCVCGWANVCMGEQCSGECVCASEHG